MIHITDHINSFSEILFLVYVSFLGIVALLSFKFIDKDFSSLFWPSALPIIAFTLLRPWNVMRDDAFYLDLFESLNWNTVTEKLASFRDPLWYTLAYILKAIWSNPRVLLLLSSLSLSFKLLIFYKMPKNTKFLVLFMYACIYWQLHDLTQLRVSVSALFFMGFIYLSIINKPILASISLFTTPLLHIQALPNLALLRTPKFISSRFFILTLSTTLILMLVGAYPKLEMLKKAIFLINNQEIIHLFLSYSAMLKAGIYNNVKEVPLIFIALLITYSIAAYHFTNTDQKKLSVPCLSILTGVLLAYLFESISDIQVRFYEYYFIGGLFIASQVKNKWSFSGLLLLSILYYIKFNVIWSIWNLHY